MRLFIFYQKPPTLALFALLAFLDARVAAFFAATDLVKERVCWARVRVEADFLDFLVKSLNSPFLATKPALRRRWMATLPAACCFLETMRPAFVCIKSPFVKPPAVRSAVPWKTCALEPTLIANLLALIFFYKGSRIFSSNDGWLLLLWSADGTTFVSYHSRNISRS